jgi:signal transduction histidine kinase
VGGRYLFYGEILLKVLREEDYARHLEALAEALPIEVAATDGRGRVVVWNAALAARAGPRELALGRPLLEALPTLARETNVDWRSLLEGALAGELQRTFPRLPLGGRVVRATIGPMGTEDTGVLGAVLCFEDITLGAREEERRRLKERADAVAAFGAGIAHEIRNPLNALSLNLQLLRERLADPATPREPLATKTDAMIAELERMDQLVTHLLEVSRGGAPDGRPTRIDDVARTVVDRMEGTARAAQVTIRHAPGSRRVLPLDRALMDRAIHNIVRNAVEAAGPGGHVWITTRDDPHSTVVVVDDDGPGIRPEDRSRVFELFWTRKRGGTGLGLPLARRAVESHGGELEVLDRPGGGARFVIHLPVEGPAGSSAAKGS